MADRLYRLKAELFRALGHPVRARLLAVLGDGERSVGELQQALGLESSGASQHLAALRRQGLVDSRREGTTVYYWVKDPRTAQLLELGQQILDVEPEREQQLAAAARRGGGRAIPRASAAAGYGLVRPSR